MNPGKQIETSIRSCVEHVWRQEGCESAIICKSENSAALDHADTTDGLDHCRTPGRARRTRRAVQLRRQGDFQRPSSQASSFRSQIRPLSCPARNHGSAKPSDGVMTLQRHGTDCASVRRGPLTGHQAQALIDPVVWHSARISPAGIIDSRTVISFLAASILAVLVVSSPAHADSSGRIAECRAETDSLKRLICYDAIPIDDSTEAAGATPSGPIATFKGTGMTTTRPFEANGPIMVRVETDSFLSLEVKPPNAQFGTAHLSTDGSTPAELYVPKGGTYLLEVMAIGPWRATVTSAQ